MLSSNISKSNLDDKYLRLENKSVKKHVIIPPKYLGNLKKGIENEILTSSQEIIDEFDGVPISIGQISLLQNVATSIDDHAYLSFYVNLDCVVFKPKIGKRVLAVVQKIAPTYIGCLICERINATIFKNDRKSSEQQNNKELDNIQIGQKILIKIQSIQNRHNTMFIISTFEKILE